MKNILVFLLLFLSISCSSSLLNKKSKETVLCPQVLYASEHSEYVDSDANIINLDNITYNAELNNHFFSEESCLKIGDVHSYTLDILFIIKPLQTNSSQISLPVYVALLDSENQFIDIQYFIIDEKINKNLETGEFIDTEISQSINIVFSSKKTISKLVLGFMLDKKRQEILN